MPAAVFFADTSFFRQGNKSSQKSAYLPRFCVDVSRNTFYAYVRGKGNPTLSSIECIASCLGVDPIAILLGIYDPIKPGTERPRRCPQSTTRALGSPRQSRRWPQRSQ